MKTEDEREIFTFKEAGDLPDIGDRCGDRTQLLVRFVTDSNEQSFLDRGLITTGRHCGGRGEGKGGQEFRLADRHRPRLYIQPVRPSSLKGITWNGVKT